jgi:hemerythrin-like domain-containing protein
MSHVPKETTVVTEALREEHRQLLPYIQRMRELADAVGDAPTETLRQGVEQAHQFLTERLIPHAEAEDRVLYPPSPA